MHTVHAHMHTNYMLRERTDRQTHTTQSQQVRRCVCDVLCFVAQFSLRFVIPRNVDVFPRAFGTQ
jgi:hypothetical protein